MTDGVIVVDKPSGCTSHDVVQRVKRLFQLKAGHAGTLDPSATGVIIIGLGRATRLLGFLQNLPKTYSAVVKFGVSTFSQDADGEITAERPCQFTEQELNDVASRFLGEIQQIPPMVSAIKVGGEPLYKAARRGEVVERKARTIRVHSLEMSGFDSSAWTVKMHVDCSSGTYIRTLASDIGDLLGCGAHLASLRRDGIGSFDLSESVELKTLESSDDKDSFMRSMRWAMRDFPLIQVDAEQRDSVIHGRPLMLEEPPAREGEFPLLQTTHGLGRPPHEAGMTAGIPIAVTDETGDLLAVYRRSSKGLKPEAVFV
ncbi:MAG: tRNA pseudouridine(55) synthase TruB [Actinomycetota bacterium]